MMEYSNWKISEIRRHLVTFGINDSHCVEKEELVKLLVDAVQKNIVPKCINCSSALKGGKACKLCTKSIPIRLKQIIKYIDKYKKAISLAKLSEQSRKQTLDLYKQFGIFCDWEHDNNNEQNFEKDLEKLEQERIELETIYDKIIIPLAELKPIKQEKPVTNAETTDSKPQKRKRDSLKADTFDANASLDNYNKSETNDDFFELLSNIDKGSSGYILILDSVTLFSSRTACAIGYSREQVIVPNYSTNSHKMLDNKFSTVYPVSVNKYLRCEEYTKVPFIGVWLDYCGFFETFSDDIEILFDKTLLARTCVFGITVSSRTKTREAAFEQIDEFIKNLARKHLFQRKKKINRTYNTIITVFYEILYQ